MPVTGSVEPSVTVTGSGARVPGATSAAASTVREEPSSRAVNPAGTAPREKRSRSMSPSSGSVTICFRSTVRVSPAAAETSDGVNTGWWDVDGSTMIGTDKIARRPWGSSAFAPSVTSKVIELAPENSGTERYCRVTSSRTGSVVSAPAPTRTVSAKVSRGLCPARTITSSRRFTSSRSPALTRSGIFVRSR